MRELVLVLVQGLVPEQEPVLGLVQVLVLVQEPVLVQVPERARRPLRSP